MKSVTKIIFGLLVPAVLVSGGSTDETLPRELEGVGITEKLGQPVDLDLTFIGEDGYPVALRSFFHKGKPVLLNLVYYSCPMLCNLVLNGQTKTLRDIPWTPGDQFEVVTVSIDPTENFGLARSKKVVYLSSYERPAPGWHFLVDHQGNVKKLAEQIGFNYRFDAQKQQYAHSAAIMVLTPEGRMSRYLYGIRFNPRDLRLALTEAAEGKFGLSVERLLLFCFHYDPQAKSYVMFATNFMRAGGALVVLVLGFVIYRFWRRERMMFSTNNLVSAK